jgi:hypothetical protein
MENLSASRPAPGQDPVDGRPVTSFGTALYLSQTNTWNGFQALTSWHQPFTGATQVTNGTPADGIQFGFATYGATYYEIYVSDIDYAPYSSSLADWSQRLTVSAPSLTPSANSNSFSLRWDRASPVSTVESRTNVAGVFQSLVNLTNILAWTNSGGVSSKATFYRLKQSE